MPEICDNPDILLHLPRLRVSKDTSEPMCSSPSCVKSRQSSMLRCCSLLKPAGAQEDEALPASRIRQTCSFCGQPHATELCSKHGLEGKALLKPFSHLKSTLILIPSYRSIISTSACMQGTDLQAHARNHHKEAALLQQTCQMLEAFVCDTMAAVKV